jgi:hypothetical protein
MFITTPFVRFTVNRLYRQGRLTKAQKENLIVQDRHINTIITLGAAFVLAAFFIG